jgi:hypothetical protein
LLYRIAVAAILDPDDYELRWPPQLFVDEANRLVGRRDTPFGDVFDSPDKWASEMEWLLTEAFLSSGPTEALKRALQGRDWVRPDPKDAEQWVSQLIEEAAHWPEPGTPKRYWSTRTVGRSHPTRMELEEVVRAFIQLIDEFKIHGYLAFAFGEECVDDQGGPGPSPGEILSRRLGYPVEWPLETVKPDLDDLCDLIEVFHDLVARPSSRWYHDYSAYGWHHSDFATGPGRRLYRWRVNRLLTSSTLGLRLAEEGEDMGRLVRVEPIGLEDLPEKALQTATAETVDRVEHAIALFRSRTAGVEERRSAVIALAGILEERRALLRAELLSKDEGALFTIANGFAIRHQRADQRGDYDSAFLDWLFWWYLGTVQLTDQLLTRHSPRRPPGVRPDMVKLLRHDDPDGRSDLPF